MKVPKRLGQPQFYERVEDAQGKASYRYRGRYFAFIPGQGLFWRVKAGVLALAGAQAAAIAAAGLGDPVFLRRLYGVVPFLLLLFFVGKQLLLALSCLTLDVKLLEAGRERLLSRLPAMVKASAVTAGALCALLAALMVGDAAFGRDATALGLLGVCGLAAVAQAELLAGQKSNVQQIG